MFSFFSKKFYIAVFALSFYLAGASPARASDFYQRLTDGHHVLLIRHADAPGVGDPLGYTLKDCSSQRNLGEYGRRQATAIGKWLGKKGVQSALVYSSPWCRCRDTAHLLGLGDVTIEESLGSFFNDPEQGQNQTKRLRTFLAQRLKKQIGIPLILVTHHVNIEAFTGKVVSVGDLVLVEMGSRGEVRSLMVYPSPKI